MLLGTLSTYSRQLAFAIAPIPAYLPQYYTLCRSSNDPVLQRKVPKISNTINFSECAAAAFDHNHNDSINTGSSSSRPPIIQPHKVVTEGGFSSTSIMILLLSHAFRLQYFLGSAIINTFRQEKEEKADKVHYDLVTQSLVMMGIQLMLLSAVTRRRRLATKRKVKDGDSRMPTSPRAASSVSQQPFIWLVQPRTYWQNWDTVHQYVELIIVLTILAYFLFRHCLNPTDFLDYISTVKLMSVLLESCLALPQIILNYKRESTEGLSLVMVLGWVVGDLMKLVYFAMSSEALKTNHEVTTVVSDKTIEESSDMTAFIFGCVFALIMDVIVGIQVTKWYPSHDMLDLQVNLRRLWRRFEIRVLRIDYEYSPSSLDAGDLSSC